MIFNLIKNKKSEKAQSENEDLIKIIDEFSQKFESKINQDTK